MCIKLLKHTGVFFLIYLKKIYELAIFYVKPSRFASFFFFLVTKEKTLIISVIWLAEFLFYVDFYSILW